MTQVTGTERKVSADRMERVRKAFFQGDKLHLRNPRYSHSVATFLEELLRSDIEPGDVTALSLQLADEPSTATILAKQAGVAAGVEEVAWLWARSRIDATALKRDGERLNPGDVLFELKASRALLLNHERVALNVLQRMSGIATMTAHVQEVLHRANPLTQVVGTRKTPWGLLDKRAVHLGGGGTHRLGLSDAILVKNNHLALLSDREEDAVVIAIDRCWPRRHSVEFIEVEVRTQESALAAGRAFRSAQEIATEDANCPCVLMLDNMTPAQVADVMRALAADGLLENVLIEVSGNVTESNLAAYAGCGVDAISIGALTHSPRVLDLCQKL